MPNLVTALFINNSTTSHERIISFLNYKTMDIQIQAIHFNADDKLIEFTKKKVGRLSHIDDKIISVDVHFKIDDVKSPVREKTALIKVHIPGSTLFCEESNKTFEEAIDKALDSLSRQLEKHKEKVRGI